MVYNKSDTEVSDMAGHHLGYPDMATLTVKRQSGILNGIFADALIVLVLVTASLLSMYTPGISDTLLRFGLIVILFMFLPGYAFVAALYPARSGPGGIERAALSVGMSLVFSPLIGFALNYTTFGVSTLPMVVSISLFTVAFMAVALYRRHRLPSSERFCLDLATPVSDAWNALSLRKKAGTNRAATVMLIISLALVIITAGFLAAVPIKHEQYTEFYIYGKNGTLAEYPLKSKLSDTAPVIVGISNHEGTAMTYNLAVTIDGIGSQRRTIYSDRFVIADNDTLEKTINLTMDRAGDNLNLQFLLYVDGVPDTPYRTCNLWVNVSAPPGAMLPANGTALL
jgi:Predicted membrane protein